MSKGNFTVNLRSVSHSEINITNVPVPGTPSYLDLWKAIYDKISRHQIFHREYRIWVGKITAKKVVKRNITVMSDLTITWKLYYLDGQCCARQFKTIYKPIPMYIVLVQAHNIQLDLYEFLFTPRQIVGWLVIWLGGHTLTLTPISILHAINNNLLVRWITAKSDIEGNFTVNLRWVNHGEIWCQMEYQRKFEIS